MLIFSDFKFIYYTRPFYLNSLKQSQYLNSLNDTRKYIYVTSSVAEESYGA